MVKKFAMSEKLGLTYFDDESIVKGLISDQTKLVIDEEVNQILKESYKRAKDILTDHQNELQHLAWELIKHETLDRNAVVKIIEEVGIENKTNKQG